MIAENVNAKEILNKYGLQVEEIEPTVYKVINTTDQMSIDEIQWELKESIAITSLVIGHKKLKSGIHSSIVYVYYILSDYDNDDLMLRYEETARKEFGRVLSLPYKEGTTAGDDIDTIYAGGGIHERGI